MVWGVFNQSGELTENIPYFNLAFESGTRFHWTNESKCQTQGRTLSSLLRQAGGISTVLSWKNRTYPKGTSCVMQIHSVLCNKRQSPVSKFQAPFLIRTTPLLAQTLPRSSKRKSSLLKYWHSCTVLSIRFSVTHPKCLCPQPMRHQIFPPSCRSHTHSNFCHSQKFQQRTAVVSKECYMYSQNPTCCRNPEKVSSR